MNKSVAIIGAGPTGIIAARKLLQSPHFTIRIFEKGNRIGGSWVPNGIINPIMRTNQSKFTMCFSDLSWESVGPSPVYPKASDVLLYLEEYCRRYIPEDVVRLCTTVKGVERISTGSEGGGRCGWKLRLREEVAEAKAKEYEATFDYLVAAPGFYNIPRMPQLGNVPIPVLHSTQYRTLNDINLGSEFGREVERKIVVVGGSHSGGDIAALIALQLSDAQCSPTSSAPRREIWKGTKVVHVSSHEMVALPAFVRDGRASSCSFQPIDFALFDRGSRHSGTYSVLFMSRILLVCGVVLCCCYIVDSRAAAFFYGRLGHAGKSESVAEDDSRYCRWGRGIC